MKLPLSRLSRLSRLPRPSALALALSAAACSAHVAAPPGVPVRALTADRITLRGTASATMANPSCSALDTGKPAHVLELPDDVRATIVLAPTPGESALPPTMLHLTHLDSNRTWCVMTQPDGTPAVLGGAFPSGQYAVSVVEARGATPRTYEVRVVKL